ncbi:MAG: MASE1 domain-containing protein [Verrucomicrobiales bacterium]|nr:MASE1 domain-containing protein [Verrucomicrobiales bacterium]
MVRGLVLAFGIFSTAWLGASLSIQPLAFVTVWFPSGLYLAALLLHRTSQWPILVAGALLGNVAFDLMNGQTAFTSFFFCTANSIESVLGAALIRRFVTDQPNFETVREVLGLVVASALISSPLAALIGATAVTRLEGSPHFVVNAVLWWSASFNGTVMLTPMLLNWAHGECPVPPGNRKRILEGMAIAVLVVLAVWFASAMEHRALGGFKYLVIPMIGWSAVRFGIRGTGIATFLVAAVFAWCQNHVFTGEEAQHLDKVQRAMSTQPFIALTGMGGLLLAAMATERRRTSLRVRENEERFRQFFENLGEYCYIVALDGRILNANGAALQALGLTRERLLDRPIASIYAPEDRPKVEAMLDRWRNGEAVRDQELSLVTVAGERRQVLLNSVPIRDPSGRVIHSASVQIDITERLRLGDQLRQAQKLEAVGRLAGGIAHDFNNIVSATLVHLGLLRTHTRLDDHSYEIIRELEAEARRAASLTRQLLLFGRRSIMEIRVLDLNEVVDNLLRMLRRLLGEHIRVEWSAGAGLPTIAADAGMVEQVVVNLAVNARDAMPEGGRLTIATEVVTVGEAECLANPRRRPGRFVCLSVRDTGTGIDDATMAHIFEPFFTTKAVGHGTGLGLATVYGIVSQHQGWVEVESAINHGTYFRIYFPASTLPLQEPEAPVGLESVRGGNETILFVEDEGSVRRAGVQYLRLLGYRVFDAVDGISALEMWGKHSEHMDLLITDVVMPKGLGGLSLAKQLKADKPGILVIVTSGYSAELDQRTATEGSGVVYLAKPYEAETLGRLVRRCLDRKQE